jgi:integrase
MASVTIVFRKDKINKLGHAPIHIRIIKDRKPRYLTTGYMVHESDWDEKNKRIKGRGKDSETNARINADISHQFANLQKEVVKVESMKRNISSKALRAAVVKENESWDFFLFADTLVEKYKQEDKIGTYSRTKTVIQKFKDYAGELLFSDITPAFLAKYEAHLRQGDPKEENKKRKPNSTNTIHANFKFIRQVFNEAFKQGIIELADNPFLKFKVKTEKTQRVYLNEEELQRFENTDLEGNKKLELHRDMFVFAAYAGGLRISDMLQLQWKHFDGERIDFTIKKTGSQLSIKLPNKALEIISKYSPKEKDPEAFIFLSLPYGVINRTSLEIDNAISQSTALINKNLKTIAKKAKINKTISFHISRHTWATRALRKGISIDKVSKLMGHAAIKETQVYAKIVNEELDKAMDVFND